MAKKNFIEGAIKHPGALKAAAKAKGMTIGQYCSQDGLSSTAKKRCNLAKTLGKLRKKGS